MTETQAESSDGLPYTQVDRAVKAKAGLLAGRLGVSPQHALGSLIHFWDLNGDPRDLEALWAAGKDEVLLTAPEVRMRFAMASGKDVDPAELTLLGLLEPREDRFRVRGMSRFFAPIKRRMAKREAGKKGGEASVEARRASKGTAQPVRAAFEVCSSTPEALAEAAPKQRRSTDRSTSEAPPNTEDRGQRTATSLNEEEEDLPLPPTIVNELVKAARANLPPPTAPPDKFADGQSFFAWAQWKRHEVGHVQEKPPRHGLSAWWSEAGMELNGDYARLEAAFYRFAEDPHWDKANPSMPFVGFMSVWRNFVPRKTG